MIKFFSNGEWHNLYKQPTNLIYGRTVEGRFVWGSIGPLSKLFFNGEWHGVTGDFDPETTTVWGITTEAENTSYAFGVSCDSALQVNWGDGTSETISSGSEQTKSHTYAAPGEYYIHLTGTYTNIRFGAGHKSGTTSIGGITYDLWEGDGSLVTSIINIHRHRFITDATAMFCGCSSLSDACLRRASGDCWSVTNATAMFQDCTQLATIITFTMNLITTAECMFKGCVNLEKADQGYSDRVDVVSLYPNLTNAFAMFEGAFINAGAKLRMFLIGETDVERTADYTRVAYGANVNDGTSGTSYPGWTLRMAYAFANSTTETHGSYWYGGVTCLTTTGCYRNCPNIHVEYVPSEWR